MMVKKIFKLANNMLFVLLMMVANSAVAAGQGMPLSEITGTWGREGCTWYIHTITFSKNKEFLEVNDDEKKYYYYIAGKTDKGFKVVMLGEDRLDLNNNPVYWYIVFKDKNTFYWLRSDRSVNDLRGPVSRCYSANGLTQREHPAVSK